LKPFQLTYSFSCSRTSRDCQFEARSLQTKPLLSLIGLIKWAWSASWDGIFMLLFLSGWQERQQVSCRSRGGCTNCQKWRHPPGRRRRAHLLSRPLLNALFTDIAISFFFRVAPRACSVLWSLYHSTVGRCRCHFYRTAWETIPAA